jgi:hypothetical protein
LFVAAAIVANFFHANAVHANVFFAAVLMACTTRRFTFAGKHVAFFACFAFAIQHAARLSIVCDAFAQGIAFLAFATVAVPIAFLGVWGRAVVDAFAQGIAFLPAGAVTIRIAFLIARDRVVDTLSQRIAAIAGRTVL